MDEELSAELLERASRDQAARTSLRPGHEIAERETAGTGSAPANASTTTAGTRSALPGRQGIR